MTLIRGNTIHKGEFVALGANNSLRLLVLSAFSFLPCSTFSCILSHWSPISTVSNSIGVLRFLLAILSISGSRGIISKLKDLQPNVHHTKSTKRN